MAAIRVLFILFRVRSFAAVTVYCRFLQSHTRPCSARQSLVFRSLLRERQLQRSDTVWISGILFLSACLHFYEIFLLFLMIIMYGFCTFDSAAAPIAYSFVFHIFFRYISFFWYQLQPFTVHFIRATSRSWELHKRNAHSATQSICNLMIWTPNLKQNKWLKGNPANKLIYHWLISSVLHPKTHTFSHFQSMISMAFLRMLTLAQAKCLAITLKRKKTSTIQFCCFSLFGECVISLLTYSRIIGSFFVLSYFWFSFHYIFIYFESACLSLLSYFFRVCCFAQFIFFSFCVLVNSSQSAPSFIHRRK